MSVDAAPKKSTKAKTPSERGVRETITSGQGCDGLGEYNTVVGTRGRNIEENMKLRHWRNAICASACLLFIIASNDRYHAVETIATDRGTKRTAHSPVPPDYVRTPAGLYHESCVHKVPQRSRVDMAARKVTLPNGRILEYERCEHPVFPSEINNRTSREFSPSYNGYLAKTMGAGEAPIGSMSAQFSVPKASSLR